MRHAAPLTLKPMDSSRNERTPLDRIPSKSVWWRPSESTRSALPIVRNQQVVVNRPLQTVWLVDLRPATEAPRGQGLAGVSIVVHRASVERRYLTRSRHLPVAVVDGSRTENLNKTGVRLWPIGSHVTRKIDSFGDTVMERSRRASNASRRPSSCGYCGFLIFSQDVERLSV
jgi:hypothetical protein